jgi:hypothetical protein
VAAGKTDYEGQPQQFAVIGNRPDPATVTQSTGLVKYELGVRCGFVRQASV